MQSGMDSGHISRKTKRITRQNFRPRNARRRRTTPTNRPPLPHSRVHLEGAPGAIPVAVAIGRFAISRRPPEFDGPIDHPSL